MINGVDARSVPTADLRSPANSVAQDAQYATM